MPSTVKGRSGWQETLLRKCLVERLELDKTGRQMESVELKKNSQEMSSIPQRENQAVTPSNIPYSMQRIKDLLILHPLYSLIRFEECLTTLFW